MIKELKELIDKKENLSPFVFEEYHGIRLPLLKKIAKQIAKEKRYDFFLEKHSCFEERTIHAYAIGYLNEPIEVKLKYMKEFIPTINSWSINDSLCQNFKSAREHQEEVYNFLLTMKDTKNEWESRVISVMLLSHFLNETYIDRVFELLDHIYKETYFSKMGVAWALATAMGKFPEETFKYLKKNSLDTWTYNKALQKMIESYRVSEEDKIKIKQLRKTC